MGNFLDYRTKETKLRFYIFPKKRETFCPGRDLCFPGTADEKREQFWDGWQLYVGAICPPHNAVESVLIVMGDGLVLVMVQDLNMASSSSELRC